jgi:hypothetical protein
MTLNEKSSAAVDSHPDITSESFDMIMDLDYIFWAIQYNVKDYAASVECGPLIRLPVEGLVKT